MSVEWPTGKAEGLKDPLPHAPQPGPRWGKAHADDSLLRLVVVDELRLLQSFLKVVHGRLEVSQLHWGARGQAQHRYVVTPRVARGSWPAGAGLPQEPLAGLATPRAN